jgi:hypothetical protein
MYVVDIAVVGGGKFVVLPAPSGDLAAMLWHCHPKKYRLPPPLLSS